MEAHILRAASEKRAPDVFYFNVIVHERMKGPLEARLVLYWRDFATDSSQSLSQIWHSRAEQLVIVLSLLPWLWALIAHRNLSVWLPLLQIVGIVLVYWFFTRREAAPSLPIPRPAAGTLLALFFVTLWMAYRVGQYMGSIAFPAVSIGFFGNVSETIVPKMLEMFFLPLAVFLLLRESPRLLGLNLGPRWVWIPALLLLLIYSAFGLSHQKPEGLLARTISFFFGAALPEEFLFRGILQPRLVALFKRPEWGIFVGALIFGVTHLPIDLHGAGLTNWVAAFETAFTFQMGVGLALGYAFYRTKSIVPLSFIHALIDSAPMLWS